MPGAMPYRNAPTEPPGSGRRCPRCDRDLVVERIGPNRVERCPGCRGVWIAAAEFNELVGDLDRREAVRARERVHAGEEALGYLACPRCGEIMARRNFGRTSGILVDTCKRHGIWLDRGELRRVVDFLAELAEPGRRPARPDPAPAPAPAPRPAGEAHASGTRPTFLDMLVDFLSLGF